MISTAHRIEYALGYVALGLFDEARAELGAIEPQDRATVAVLEATLTVHQAADQWDKVEEIARQLIEQDDGHVGAWIALGCAVRRAKGFTAARDLLLVIEPRFGDSCATLHYNLGCYHCLLGELTEAKERLIRAFAMDDAFRALAKADPDLQPLWSEIEPLR